MTAPGLSDENLFGEMAMLSRLQNGIFFALIGLVLSRAPSRTKRDCQGNGVL